MASVGYQEVAEQNYEGSAPPLVAADSDTDYSLESLESDVALSSREAWNEARNRKVKLQIANANEQDSSAREGQRFDKTEINLCQEQQDLIDLIASGRNVFFTGSAGCGKSTVLKAAVAKLGHMNRTVHVVAPTGRAALQVNGVSTWSYMGWTPDYDKLSTEELVQSAFRKHVRRRLQSTDVLIIDEISMVENHHLERMDVCMKAARQWGQETSLPFGGVQVVVTGDFCQLPPVKPFQHCVVCGNEMEETVESDDDDFKPIFICPNTHGPFKDREKWAFMSKAWEECDFTYVELKQIHRQKDEHFLKMLQKCRLGIPFSQDETDILINHPCHVTNATRLFSTRREAAKVNSDNFNKLRTPIVIYQTLDGFNWNREQHPHLGLYSNRLTDGSLAVLKDHRLERHVQLRIGMIVVLQVNLSLQEGLCNGSQGIICGFEDYCPEKLPKARARSGAHTDHPIIHGDHAVLKEEQISKFIGGQRQKLWPRVLFHNGKKRTIYADCTVNSVGDEPYSLLHRTQIPLIAAWAMSIHKSRGMTLDRVIVDLTRAFEEGQVYVALSRATSLQGLRIQGSPQGLSVGLGGNREVQRFLREKFASELSLS